MKEKILEAFGDLGFMLEETEGMGYSFNYEGLNLLYMYNENDEEFFSIALPGIIEVEEGKLLQTCGLLEKINSSLKYVKAYMIGNSVWLFYEHELLGNEDLKMIIPHMILHLEAARGFSHKAMLEIEDAISNNQPEEEDAEEAKADEIEGNDNNQ